MKYPIVLLLAGSLCFILSCKKSELSGCTPEQINYTFSTNKQVDTVPQGEHTTYQINNGNNLVFLYQHIGKDCKEVDNEEFTEDLVFEIPAGATSFSYSDEELRNIKCYFRKLNWAEDPNLRPVTEGTIQGTKVDAQKWDIQLYITIPEKTNTFNFDTTFVAK